MSLKRDFDFKMDEAEMEIKLADVSIPHPSEKFREFLIKAKLEFEPANKIAKILGISRTAYYDFLNAENGISPEIAIRLARFFHDFDPSLYPKAASPYYWWELNNRWIFVNWIQNPKNRNKKNNVGIKRFKVDENNKIDTVEDKTELEIDDMISISFKHIDTEKI